jgi:hypothetical protein
MSDPWVVVVGTLGGVILTSVTGLIGIIPTTRHQRAIAELGAPREVEDRLRDERRETFVNYLTAYQDMYGKALAIATSRFQDRSEDEPFPLGPSFLERAPEETFWQTVAIFLQRNVGLRSGRADVAQAAFLRQRQRRRNRVSINNVESNCVVSRD